MINQNEARFPLRGTFTSDFRSGFLASENTLLSSECSVQNDKDPLFQFPN